MTLHITRYRTRQRREQAGHEEREGKNRPTSTTINRPPRPHAPRGARRGERHAPEPTTQPSARNTLRIIPIGGLEEVGRNSTIYEYNDDIIIVDLGLQFPDEDMPGIDYIIPNLSYLRGKEKRIRGVFITHGHYDHIGAIPHLMPKLGNPPLYAAPLTAGIIMKRQEEYPRAPKLHIVRIDSTRKVPVGKHFVVEPFHVNHNISDAFGLAIHTPIGTIIHTRDFKFDYTPVNDRPADIGRIAELGNRGALVLLSDSTNAHSPGYQISEQQVGEGLEQIITKAEGRIIIGTFSSLLTRHQQILDIAHKLGYLKFKKGVIMEEEDFKRLSDNKIIVICTGAQGEKNAALMRIANDNDRLVSIKRGDTIIFSSSVIPGNERTVAYLHDALTRRGAKVVNYQMMDVHAGGHAKQEDLKLLLRLIRPKYFIPIHGQHFQLRQHADLAAEAGVEQKNIFVADNGQIIEFVKDSGKLTDKKVSSDYVFVDGLGVGDV